MLFNFQNTYNKLPESFYSKQLPSPVKEPKLLYFNTDLANELNLNIQNQEEELTLILAGNKLSYGSEPIAQAYAGHQFGHFTILGDGRAILLGEILDKNQKRKDIQLKGCGKTAFSRGGDGRATLSSVLREYIISESMYALNIPTTRSLAVIGTVDKVFRRDLLASAVLTRIADSHIRVGTFECFEDTSSLKILADYVIERHYSHIQNTPNKYLELLENIINAQAQLIAKWMNIGFVHGVMNTDNMTISGETIDYGPCAFIDEYNPDTVFSFIDTNGRYSFSNQAGIALWNLSRLAESLLPLFDSEPAKALEKAKEKLYKFSEKFEFYWLNEFRRKLGLQEEIAGDHDLCRSLLDLMHKNKADFTNTFRNLSKFNNIFPDGSETKNANLWLETWRARLKQEKTSSQEQINLMNKHNPVYIPRNHRVEQALLEANQGDFSLFDELLEIMKKPFSENTLWQKYTELPSEDERVKQTFCGT